MKKPPAYVFLCLVLVLSVVSIQLLVVRMGVKSDGRAEAPQHRAKATGTDAMKKMTELQLQVSDDMELVKMALSDLVFEVRRLKLRINPTEGHNHENTDADQVIRYSHKFSRFRIWYKSIEEVVRESVKTFNLSKILERVPPGSALLDIGANIGAFTDYLADACPSCSVYSFEPIEEYAEFIRHNYHGHRNVHVYPLGLGDTNENLTLWVSEDNLGWNTLIEDRTDSSMKATTVKVVTFDQWSSVSKIRDFAFAKIDVEGAEYKVLRGMMRSLEKMYPKPVLFIEIGWGREHPNWKEELEVFEWLFNHGYQRVDIGEISSTTDVLLLPECYPSL